MQETQEENILNVIMYLFKHHMAQGTSLVISPDSLTEELESAGFSKPSIKLAFNWLENLSADNQEKFVPPQTDSIRVFQGLEAHYINRKCQDYIHYLTRTGILTVTTREFVIDQLLNLRDINVDISLLKWVTLLVLYNQEESEEALKRMELLVMENTELTIH